jgi:hypothetical protein
VSEFAPEPVEPAAVEGAEIEAPEPAWAGPPQEEWEAAQETLALINQAIQEPAQQYQQPYQEQQPQIDPLAEDFQTQLDQYLEQKFAPYASYQEQLVMGEAEEKAKDIIHSLEQEKGEFLDPKSSELALQRANQYLPDTQAKYGYGPRAAEAALARAYDDIKQLEDTVGKAYYERQINQIRGLSNAPREAGVSGQQAGQQVSIPEGGDEFSLVSRYFQQNR